MSSNRKRKIEEQPQLAIKAEVAEDHQLLLSNKDASLWLVKVPQFIAKMWAEKASDGEVIGHMGIESVKEGGKSTSKISVTLADLAASAAPVSSSSTASSSVTSVKDFYLEDNSTTTSNTHVLAFKPPAPTSTEHFAVLGQVTKTLLLKPKDSRGEYRQVMREKQALEQIRHTTKAADPNRIFMATRPISDGTLKIEKVLPSAVSKITRNLHEPPDPAQLRTRVLQEFQKNERLSVKEIMSAVARDLPGAQEKMLRTQLDVFAIYSNSGVNRGTWELKKEYKSHGK